MIARSAAMQRSMSESNVDPSIAAKMSRYCWSSSIGYSG